MSDRNGYIFELNPLGTPTRWLDRDRGHCLQHPQFARAQDVTLGAQRDLRRGPFGWILFDREGTATTLTHSRHDPQTLNRTEQILTTMAALAVGAAFFALWFWLLPGWLGFRVETAGSARWRSLAAVPSVLGFAVALRCVWDFGWTGRGTPAPFAPPQRLVVKGFYRYVRNPMYLGFAAGWIGLWVIFGHASRTLIVAVAAVALGVKLFVLFYEEPMLRRKFGNDYEEYCRNVSRWWPRVRGWPQE